MSDRCGCAIAFLVLMVAALSGSVLLRTVLTAIVFAMVVVQ